MEIYVNKLDNCILNISDLFQLDKDEFIPYQDYESLVNLNMAKKYEISDECRNSFKRVELYDNKLKYIDGKIIHETCFHEGVINNEIAKIEKQLEKTNGVVTQLYEEKLLNNVNVSVLLRTNSSDISVEQLITERKTLREKLSELQAFKNKSLNSL